MKEPSDSILEIQLNRMLDGGRVVPWIRVSHNKGDGAGGHFYSGPPPENATVDGYHLQSAWLQLVVADLRYSYELAEVDGAVVIKSLTVSGHNYVVPRGGLTTRQLRSASTEWALEQARDLYWEIQKWHSETRRHRSEKAWSDPVFECFQLLGIQRPIGEQPRRRQRPDYVTAEIAATYASLVADGWPNPRQETAGRHGYSAKGIDVVLRDARERDMLTRPPSSGKPGGSLTYYGQRLLATRPPD